MSSKNIILPSGEFYKFSEVFTPPKKGKNNNYDNWEYSYYPYLVYMYKQIFQDQSEKKMYKFFKFLFDNSSGEISPFLKEMEHSQLDEYFNYLIKRKN